MKWKNISLNIEVMRIDNGYVTMVKNQYGMVIASWYDSKLSNTVDKIAAQLAVCYSIDSEEDDPLPFTKGLDGKELTEDETEGMNEEMKEIRDEHLKNMEENNEQKETNTKEDTND